jgi:hypothetical protein
MVSPHFSTPVAVRYWCSVHGSAHTPAQPSASSGPRGRHCGAVSRALERGTGEALRARCVLSAALQCPWWWWWWRDGGL